MPYRILAACTLAPAEYANFVRSTSEHRAAVIRDVGVKLDP